MATERVVELPIHVRVAQALAPSVEPRLLFPQNVSSIAEDGSLPPAAAVGVWYRVHRLDEQNHDCPYRAEGDTCNCTRTWFSVIPSYDTDWSATGPLITKHRIYLLPHTGYSWNPDIPPDGWIAQRHQDEGDECWGHGSDPLLAVCSLILAAKRQGKTWPTS